MIGGRKMRLKITKTKSATNYYIIKDINKNGKRSTAIYERLGTEEEITQRANGEEIFSWIKNYIENLEKFPLLFRFQDKACNEMKGHALLKTYFQIKKQHQQRD